MTLTTEEMRAQLFAPSFRRELQGYGAREVFHGHGRDKSFADPLALVQYLDYKTYLPGDILTKVDRASMAHSLEVRTPFLDYELVEWASSLPSDVKLRGSEGKHVLKRALEPVLPREVLYRDKMGFAVPLDTWFRGSLRGHIRIGSDRLFSDQSAAYLMSDWLYIFYSSLKGFFPPIKKPGDAAKKLPCRSASSSCSTEPSKHPLPTANGSLTSPMSGRRRAGCMWLPSSICSPAASSVGR